MKRGALAAWLLLPACAGPAPLGEGAQAIIGGTPTTGDPAVVLLVSYPPDHSTFDACTASVIAPTVLLTAAHCLDPQSHPGYAFGVFTGPDASAYPTANVLVPQLGAAAKEVHLHPDYDPNAPFHADLGVVVLDQAIAAAPLPVSRSPVSAALVGAPARIVGYGQTVYDQYNAQKHEATTVLSSIGTDDTIVVGDGMHRSCIGDSGGPALVKLSGVETIVGVDSYTELKGCLEPASYRRPDLYLAFIDSYAPPAAVDAGPLGGGGAGTGGSGGESHGGCGMAPGSPGGAAWLLALLAVAISPRRARPGSPRAARRCARAARPSRTLD